MILKFEVMPLHPFAFGVNVIVAITGELVEFVAINEGIFPVPFAASPMEVLLFVHE